MKYLTLIPLVFVASCASHPQLVVRPAPPPPIEPIEAVRYSDVVRAYYLGRYVEPRHPEIMQGQHPVYRIESSAHWNLRPGSSSVANVLNPPSDAAFALRPTNDIVLAEINHQRELTERVIQEAARLAQSYVELQKVIGEMKGVARNNAELNARLINTEKCVAEFDKELRKLSVPATPQTNDVPAFAPDPPGMPKP